MPYNTFGIGLLEWVFICIPALVITGVILAGTIYVINHNRSTTRQNLDQVYQTGAYSNPPAPKADRYCSHCGAGLQSDWSHCPKCGAPIQ